MVRNGKKFCCVPVTTKSVVSLDTEYAFQQFGQPFLECILIMMRGTYGGKRKENPPKISPNPNEYTIQPTVLGRAATFKSVNSTVLCFCNKCLQNWPTIYTGPQKRGR